MQQLFMARYRAALRREFPQSPVFFGFKRIFFSGRKPAAEAAPAGGA
jgi:trans-aconitate methyltransferase